MSRPEPSALSRLAQQCVEAPRMFPIQNVGMIPWSQ